MRTLFLIGLGLVAAGAAAIVLNLVLLGYTSPPGEPVGKLSPALPIKVVQKPVPKPPVRRGERDD